MKAYVLNGINQLDFCEIPKPVLQEGEVLVEVKAAGICGSDIPRIFKTGTYHFPTIPGHEFSGVVKEVREEEHSDLIGKRVGVFPLIPCMECVPCKEKKYEMCLHYNYLGSRRDGGFAEYVAVPTRNLMVLPEEISFEQAAMLEPVCVALHALRRVDLQKVKSAVVFGPGTIGLLAAQWLRKFGIEKVFLAGTNASQMCLAKQLGFADFYNNKEENVAEAILQQTGGQGADLALECTGYGNVLTDCIKSTKRGGEIVVVGNPHDDIEVQKDVYWQILRKQLKLYGTWNSSFVPEDAEDDWKIAIEAIMKRQILPEKQITHRLSFGELQKGLEVMRDKTEFFNKVMVFSE